MAPLEGDDELFRVTNLRAIHYTFLGNLFRMCGLALPSGTDAAGLPTGVQFLAPGGDDDRLLSIGLSMEKALSRLRQRHFPLYDTRQIEPLPSSLTSSEPSCVTATPTGRPQTLLSSPTKPTRKSSYAPVGLPSFITRRTTL